MRATIPLSATTRVALLLVVAAPLLRPSPAAAQPEKYGAVYYVNQTDTAIKIEGRHIVDFFGNKEAIPGYWTLKPREGAFLMRSGKKLFARQFHYTLTTAAGSSNWQAVARALDADGDFAIALTEANLAEHARTVAGAAAPFGAPPRAPVAATGPDEEAVKKAIAKILGAAVANAASKPKDDDGLGVFLLRFLAKEGRDELIKSALEDLFPNAGAATLRASTRVVSLLLDDQLTVKNLGERTAKEELIEALKKENADAGSAAQVADFLYRLAKERK